MKTYIPLDRLKRSRDSGSALYNMHPTDVLGRAGGGIDCNRLCHYHFFKNLIGWITFVHSRGCIAFSGCFLCFGLVGMDFRQKCSIFWCRMKKGWGSFSWGELV